MATAAIYIGWRRTNCWSFILEGTRRLNGGWVFRGFVEFGIAELSGSANPAAIAPELDNLAARLGRYPRVLSHRDYHGHNLFLQTDGALRRACA